MNLDEPRTIAHDLEALITRVEQKEKADAKHMEEMHKEYDRKIFKLEARVKALEEQREKESNQLGAAFANIVHRLEALEYRGLDVLNPGDSLGANLKHLSIVDEVFKARK